MCVHTHSCMYLYATAFMQMSEGNSEELVIAFDLPLLIHLFLFIYQSELPHPGINLSTHACTASAYTSRAIPWATF